MSYPEAAEVAVTLGDQSGADWDAVEAALDAHARRTIGDLEGAEASLRQALERRVALTGESSVTTARARNDLAVVLAERGSVLEARVQLMRAITSITVAVGDEDTQLVDPLDNAARLALRTGGLADAEPLLLRLHGVLAANDLDTERADRWLSRLRAPAAASEALGSATKSPGTIDADASASSEQSVAAPVDAIVPELSIVDVFGGAELDLIDIDDYPDTSAPVHSTPALSSHAERSSRDVLGLSIEYGTPETPVVPDPAALITPGSVRALA
jgi:hypothetical protein